MSGFAVEAKRWDGSEASQAEIVNWGGGAITGWFDREYFLEVRTEAGPKRVVAGDMIFRGSRGEFYVGGDPSEAPDE